MGIITGFFKLATLAGIGSVGYAYRDEALDGIKGGAQSAQAAVTDENGEIDVKKGFDKAKEALIAAKEAAVNVGASIDGARNKAEETVGAVTNTYETAQEVTEKAKETLDAFNGTSGEDGFDFMKMLKWAAVIGTGGFIASQATGGAVGIGLTCLIGAAAFAYMNKDMVTGLKDDLVSKVTDNVNSNKGFDNSGLTVPGMD